MALGNVLAATTDCRTRPDAAQAGGVTGSGRSGSSSATRNCSKVQAPPSTKQPAAPARGFLLQRHAQGQPVIEVDLGHLITRQHPEPQRIGHVPAATVAGVQIEGPELSFRTCRTEADLAGLAVDGDRQADRTRFRRQPQHDPGRAPRPRSAAGR